MRKSDRELGLGRDITRRDFLQRSAFATLGLPLAPGLAAGVLADADYPPTRTGLRGSHPGSFEVAHALAREGRVFPPAEDSGERYDLVVVGGGISGLATALYYQDRFGKDTRILILENHDDFGGHAKRNEFHQGGELRLALGGVHNLEYTQFSDTARGMMDRLGIDFEALKAHTGFGYGYRGPGHAATWFDAETFGQDVLLPGARFRFSNPSVMADQVAQMPLSPGARARLEAFYRARRDVLPGLDWNEKERRLSRVPWYDFLRAEGGLDDECLALFDTISEGAEGFGAVNLSTREALGMGLPGGQLLGLPPESSAYDYAMVMFPDGNASVARLMVAQLVPEVAPGVDVSNVAITRFDYGQLDRPGRPVRLRLEATAIGARNTDGGVAVEYVRDGAVHGVRARHCVLACYHSIIPWLCPELPETQKAAQRYQVKCPLLLTNVLLRSSAPLRRAGITAAHCPGRLHADVFQWQGNTAGGYAQGSWERKDGAVDLVFWGSVAPPPGPATLKERLRASRARMLSLTFEDYEREVRTVLDGMLGPFGLDVREDVLAVTVNRWPHGYAYWYTDLWDPAFEDGQWPHEVARRPCGAIAIANADAAADAYTHAAIDQGRRAVQDLPGN